MEENKGEEDSEKKQLRLPLGPIECVSFGSGFKDDNSGNASLCYRGVSAVSTCKL